MEKTDIEHPAAIKDIIAYLEKNGISSTRKTITGDIDCQRSTIDENHFSVKTRVSSSPTFYGWVFSFAGKVKITSPDEVVMGFEMQ